MNSALWFPPLPDTSFMYMIAGLCMLKLYQKRHPDINASAYTAYACLAAVIFFSVLGVVRSHTQTHLAAAVLELLVIVLQDAASLFWFCRFLGKETWCSGSFSLSSTSWPPCSSAHSSTTWADGGSVRSQH